MKKLVWWLLDLLGITVPVEKPKSAAEKFRENVYADAKKSYGLCPPPISAEKGMRILTDHFLGEDWYVTISMRGEQAYTEAIYEILMRNEKKRSLFERFLNMFVGG